MWVLKKPLQTSWLWKWETNKECGAEPYVISDNQHVVSAAQMGGICFHWLLRSNMKNLARITMVYNHSRAVVPNPSRAVVPNPSRTVVHNPSRTVVPNPSRAVVPNPSRAVVPNPSRTVVHNPSRTVVPNPSRAVVPNPSRAVVPKPFMASPHLMMKKTLRAHPPQNTEVQSLRRSYSQL